MDDLIPPPELMSDPMTGDGTTTAEQFTSIGEGFTNALLVGRARLAPTEAVLDVGCGLGQKARPLTTYLTTGTYDGLDIVEKGIAWCRARYQRYPNFRFQVGDLFSTHYNPTGRFRDSEYRLPYVDASFDVVFLSSVFTHMQPAGVAQYLREIARVLKPGGRCLATYFLVNEQPRRHPPLTSGVIRFPHAMNGFWVRNAENLSEAVAHPESNVRELHAKAALRIVEIAYGTWCGGRDLLGALQDSVIAIRE